MVLLRPHVNALKPSGRFLLSPDTVDFWLKDSSAVSHLDPRTFSLEQPAAYLEPADPLFDYLEQEARKGKRPLSKPCGLPLASPNYTICLTKAWTEQGPHDSSPLDSIGSNGV
ncbi:hypothetical protein TNCV_4347951 [Trichonephila clavipes]|nr:hypothetical protein TNCV_4347951 [Trichonephila clavipes]